MHARGYRIAVAGRGALRFGVTVPASGRDDAAPGGDL